MLSVVAFHLNPTWIPGGFLGVDIFFVISGFLITGIISRELEAGTFSLRRFYERRARRILPALMLVIASSLALGFVLMDATQLKTLAFHVLGQAVFIQNFMFWQESGYFAAPSELVPLLHTWSLAVEEQFYLLFPIALTVAFRWRRRTLLLVISVAMALSLLAAQAMIYVDRSAGFYLLPFRAWELLAGALLALLPKGGAKHGAGWLAFAGAALIAVSMALLSTDSQHPSVYTVPVVFGACLLIRFGDAGLLGMMLKSRPFVVVGLISYSLYLWHWPILAFVRMANLGTLPEGALFWILPACFVLAWASWRFVETPARDRSRVGNRTLARVTGAAAAGLVVASTMLVIAGGIPGRLGFPSTLEASFVRDPSHGTCLDNPGSDRKPDGWFCELGDVATGPITFVVIGDSHAYSAIPAFREVARSLHVRAIAITDSGCPPALGIRPHRDDQDETDCPTLNQRMVEFVQREHPAHVFLAANWTYYTLYGQTFDDLSTGQSPLAAETETRIEALGRGLDRAVAGYLAAGSAVTVMAQVPRQLFSPREMYKSAYLPFVDTAGRLDEVSVSRQEYDDTQRAVNERLRQSGADFLDPADVFCDYSRCLVGTPDISYYFDNDHLSVKGSKRLTSLFEGALGAL